MFPRIFHMALRAACAALFILGAVLAIKGNDYAQAKTEVFQEATDYPYMIPTLEDNFSYPVETNTPAVGVPTPTSTATPSVPQPPGMASPSPTAPQPGTLAPDVFATENAQIGDSLSTPSASATPGPSITPVNSPTTTVTSTGTPAAAAVQDKGSGGFKIHWGFFMAGFVIPLLAGCGVVLYLLDRRPDLFTSHPKS